MSIKCKADNEFSRVSFSEILTKIFLFSRSLFFGEIKPEQFLRRVTRRKFAKLEKKNCFYKPYFFPVKNSYSCLKAIQENHK